jgi:hypothetical protein
MRLLPKAVFSKIGYYILCDLKSYEDTSPSYVLFREGGAGDVTNNLRGVTKRVNARDENEINNTGFGVNRYRCVHTPVLEVRQYLSTTSRVGTSREVPPVPDRA